MLALPTQSELLERFDYNPETGDLTYKTHRSAKYIGTKVKTDDRYSKVRVNGKRYKVHRLIWMIMTGEDPGEMFVDHINQDKQDNRWCNLRLATKVQNGVNVSRQTNHLTPWGYLVRCSDAGKRVYVGTFKTQEEAQAAYSERLKLLHGEFAPA